MIMMVSARRLLNPTFPTSQATSDKRMPPKIAIVGGGISGAVAASRLGEAGYDVTVFDQGQRGPGGRASHRRVDGATQATLPDDDAPTDGNRMEFDHGCQFFRADAPAMQALVKGWCDAGWAAPWDGRFGRLAEGSSNNVSGGSNDDSTGDFFGLPGDSRPVYVGVGGMQRLTRAVLASTGENVAVRRGERVSGIDCSASGGWVLRGEAGPEAFHDTVLKESKEARAVTAAAGSSKTSANSSVSNFQPPSTSAEAPVLGNYDAVVLTDISSSFGAWHRASAGVPEELAARVRGRVRVPMFSCMVGFASPLQLPLDGFVAPGSSTLWWAARNNSKPGIPSSNAEGCGDDGARDTGEGDKRGIECWTLVSTPGYAASEITRVPMQNTKTGAFIPQSNDYLNVEPGPALLEAFKRAAKAYIDENAFPEVVYLQAQRWGSALPAPTNVDGRNHLGWKPTTTRVMEVDYETEIPPLVQAPTPGQEQQQQQQQQSGGEGQDTNGERRGGGGAAGSSSSNENEGENRKDFAADDELRLYYCGDFVSQQPPGFEAAALSAAACAAYIARTL